MSKQEKSSWVLLAVNVIVGIWYFSAIFALGADVPLHAPQMGQLIARITIVAIAVAILGEIVMHAIVGKAHDAVELDERDRIIGLKACRNGYFVLVSAVIVLMVALVAAIGFTHRVPSSPPGIILSFLKEAGEAIFMANLLLCALVLTEIAIQSSRIFYYRRGY